MHSQTLLLTHMHYDLRTHIFLAIYVRFGYHIVLVSVLSPCETSEPPKK
jgi:hypothetical protein